MPTNAPSFPTLRQLYAWSLAQPPGRLSRALPRSCPLAQYWRDQGRELAVRAWSINTLDGLQDWPLAATLTRFVAAYDDAASTRSGPRAVTPHEMRLVIEGLERDAMLAALEETLC